MRTWGLVLIAACGAACGSPTEPYDGPNRIFATSTVHSANFGGRAAADAICAERADEAGLQPAGDSGRFVAWLATQNDGTTFTLLEAANERGWVNMAGDPVADRPSDFITRSVLGPVIYDELGRDTRSTQSRYWTGMAADGSFLSGCQNWASNSFVDAGHRGSTSGGGENFLSSEGAPCDAPARILCLELGRPGAVAITPATGRYVFVTSQSWLPNPGGVADADALCTSEATAAALPGTYKALLAPGTTPPADRLTLDGAPWIRRDGALLADTARQFFLLSGTRMHVAFEANGTIVPGSTPYWAGDPNSADPLFRCTDWTTPLPMGSSTGGSAFWADHRGMFYSFSLACADPHRLLCFQD